MSARRPLAGLGRDRAAAAGQHRARLHHRRHHRAHHRRRSVPCAAAPGAWARSARPKSIGYTLYYATNFIFTGLAVAVAFHAGLFNIGGEGQAYIGGLGCGLAILALDRYLPAWLMIPLAIARGGAVRRGLGRRAGLAAGLARQPHRHHHHHVQLRRLGADGLPDGERADRAGLDDAAEPRLRAVGQAAVDARHAGGHRHPGGALGAQPVDRAGARSAASASGCSCGTRRGAMRCAPWATIPRPRSMPAPTSGA